MALTIRSRAARLFSAAVVDQVLLSAANFLVGLILIRLTPDRDYALYVLLQSALVLVTTTHSAWVSGPLAMLAPKREAESKREMIGSIWMSQSRLLWPAAAACLLIPAAGYFTGELTASMSLVIAIGIVAAWGTAQRNYLRNALIMYSRARTLVGVDTLYILVLLIGMVWAPFAFGAPAVWVAVALAAAAWAGTASASRAFGKQPGWAFGDAGPMWRELRSLGIWSLMGTIIYWLFSRSYNYILAVRLDLKAVADVNVVRMMVMPAILLTVGLQSMLTPVATAWNVEIGFERLLRRLLAIVLVVGIGQALYFAVIWMLRGWVITQVFHKHFGGRDLLLFLWILISIIGLARECLVTAVYALGRLKWLAWQNGFCAATALGIAWFGIPFWGAAAALVALVVGELMNLLGILYLIQKGLRQFRLRGEVSCQQSR